MRLIYISNQRLPTEKAYGIQIAKMCEAFGDLASVGLIFPTRKSKIKQDIFEYYGIQQNFNIKELYSPDFYLPGRLDRFAFILKNFISAIVLIVSVLSAKGAIIYSRDELPLFLLSFFKKDMVFEAHGFSNRRAVFYRRFKKANIKIISISQRIKSEFLNIGFEDRNLLVAHDGVDLNKFCFDLSKEEARIKKGLSLDKKIVMYTGHLFSWKGVETLALVGKKRPDMDFIFIGGTDDDIYNFRNRFLSATNLKVIGRKLHAEIPLYLKAADVLVLPNSAKDRISLFTSPLKLFEYMASGRPIVASNLPSIREVLNENNSVLCNPDDPKSLESGIQKVLDNPGLAEEITAEALKDVQNYTWKKRSESIINFISHVKR